MDAIGLLEGSVVWSDEDQRGISEWIAQYFQWMLEDERGLRQAGEQDHHGTLYDLQAACFALFVGEEAECCQILERNAGRIDLQIGMDGSQPRELASDRTLDSCVINLSGFFDLATLGDKIGVDLWGYESKSGGSLEKSFSWLMETALEREWPYKQPQIFDRTQLLPLLRRGAIKFREAKYKVWLEALSETDPDSDRTSLLYPVSQSTPK